MSPFVIALWVLGLVAVATALGLWWQQAQGRQRRPQGLNISEAQLSTGTIGEEGAFVLFTTTFCTRCPQVRRLLNEVTAARPTLTVAEADLTHRPDIAKAFSILQTPTTFLVDAEGQVRLRIDGVPTRASIQDALRTIFPAPSLPQEHL